ncbi:MAG: hypothetical protein K0A89_10020 [ANME-2 cluster archaeon]|nr:hypothetical protein [ANME-2 cluster archaeon]
MKKVIYIFILISIFSMSTVVSSASSAESTGTLTLDFTSDTQVKATESLSQNKEFQPLYIEIVKNTDGIKTIYWEDEVIEPNEAPHSRAVGYLMSQATEVALTMACPNRSRAAGYND